MSAKQYKILAGCCVKQDPAVLDAHLRSLAALKVPAGCDLKFAFVNDGAAGSDYRRHSTQLLTLDPVLLLPAEQRPLDAAYAIGNETHAWSISAFEHLARQKQRLLDYACEAGYSHVFFVDSDLLLEPTTLLSLWAARAPIANAVFWTAWQAGSQPQPQCWLQHPYALAGLGMDEHEFTGGLADRQIIRCLGGGACVLIATDACKRGVRYHPRLAGLPADGMWQGEDRTFALLAASAHIRQLADGWPDVFHAYHPEQRTQQVLDEVWAYLNAPRQEQAKYGDQISLTVDPLEDAQLQQSISLRPEIRCVRGRLGQLKLAPEIEAAVTEMKVGEERLVEVHFPPWSGVAHYRGQRKLLRVRLLDAKPYSFAPVLSDVAFAGVGNA